MKKLLLFVSLICLIAFTGLAQSLQLSNASGTLAPNAFLIQVGTPDSAVLLTHLWVKNISSASVSVRSKKVEVAKADSVSISMCWAGNCYPDTTFISPRKQTIGPGETNFEFLGDYTAITATYYFNPGESIVRWIFFNDDDPTDSVCVTVKYITYPLGQDENGSETGITEIYPNPASTFATCRYAVPATSRGAVTVRDLLGSAILSQPVAPGNGTLKINVTDLSDGIYFCSLLVGGKAVRTQKLVVKH